MIYILVGIIVSLRIYYILLKKFYNKHYQKTFWLTIFLLLTVYDVYQRTKTVVTVSSEIERLGSIKAYNHYYYPSPPEGKWVATYTKDFAEKFNLPEENISNELDDFVSYIEIYPKKIYQPKKTKDGKTATGEYEQDCIVNLLANKNNDISLITTVAAERRRIEIINSVMSRLDKPLQFGNYNKYNATYRWTGGYSGVNSQDLVDGYDYFSFESYKCKLLLSSLKDNKSYTRTNIGKASVFGLYNNNYSKRKHWEKLKSQNNKIDITIPYKLIRNLYKDIDVTRRLKSSYRLTIRNIISLIYSMVLFTEAEYEMGREMQLAKKKQKTKIKIKKPEFKEPYIEGKQTHFKLTNPFKVEKVLDIDK